MFILNQLILYWKFNKINFTWIIKYIFYFLFNHQTVLWTQIKVVLTSEF